MINKEKILEEAKTHLTGVIEVASFEQENVRKTIIRLQQRVNNFASTDDKVEAVILGNNRERAKQLEQVIGSPYFMRCDVRFGADDKEYYFGKFQLSDANVYSWVSPIAQLRFAPIGEASYKLPKGELRTGMIQRKDQFMIVDGQVMFMASEAQDYQRSLIYQEHLAVKKSDFVLPEIIAQMEKAQDEVIRASHNGSFLIAGPAGSGKTTLAFHRIAYLTQSPDTAKLFPGFNIIVFVQDESTKNYFCAILPQLGIEEVTVTTFEEWALDILALNNYQFVQRYGATEREKDELEYYKNLALKKMRTCKSSKDSPAEFLNSAYREHMPEELMTVLEKQHKTKLLDRFDLTILLKTKMEQGSINVMRRVAIEDKHGKLKMAEKNISLAYSFIVVDEAENYLAEQIQIIKSTANDNQALLYVGDLAQQTKLGTIKNWEEAGEDFAEDSKVILDKVYRNTKQILEYASQQGYAVQVPEGLKTGSPVVQKQIAESALLSELKEIISDNQGVSVGVLYGAEHEYRVNDLKEQFYDNVKFLSFNEAQGVEFEVVVLCRFNDTELDLSAYPEELNTEKAKVRRDLWYVALTRSLNQLYILNIG